jgi:hypothetical protein
VLVANHYSLVVVPNSMDWLVATPLKPTSVAVSNECHLNP